MNKFITAYFMWTILLKTNYGLKVVTLPLVTGFELTTTWSWISFRNHGSHPKHGVVSNITLECQGNAINLTILQLYNIHMALTVINQLWRVSMVRHLSTLHPSIRQEIYLINDESNFYVQLLNNGIRTFIVVKNGPTPASFCLFLVFSKKYNFNNNSTFGSWVSSHNNYTRLD